MSILKNNAYQIIASLFNNTLYSDCKVFFQKSETTICLHKNVVCSQSPFFQTFFATDVEGKNNTLEIEEYEDQQLMTDLIKSMYVGEIPIRNNTDIVPLIPLAEKYLPDWVPKLTEFLANNLNEENALQCMQLNLDNYPNIRNSFNSYIKMHANRIIDHKSFLNLELQQFQLILTSLVNNSTYSSKGPEAVQAWIEYDVENRSSHCFALTKLMKEVAAVTFDPEYCGRHAILSSDRRRIEQGRTSKDQGAGALCTKCHRYSIRIFSGCSRLFLGFAPKQHFNKEGNNDGKCGYMMSLQDGFLYAQGGIWAKPYFTKCYENGTTIAVQLDNNTISFAVNGKNCGIAFKNVTGELFPAFDLHESLCSFELIS
jgi:hypothetical protein